MNMMSETDNSNSSNLAINYGYSGFGGITELEDALDDAGIDSFDFELTSEPKHFRTQDMILIFDIEC